MVLLNKNLKNSFFKHASVSAGGALRTVCSKNGFSYPRILTDWDKIVGKDIADLCHPIRVRFGKGYEMGATLVVYVAGAVAPEIEYRKAQIIDKINTYYGYRAIHKISCTQAAVERTFATKTRREKAQIPLTPEEKNAIHLQLFPIQNKDLKKALTTLATYRHVRE